MKPPQVMVAKSSGGFALIREWRWSHHQRGDRRFCEFWKSSGMRVPAISTEIGSTPTRSNVPLMASDIGPGSFRESSRGKSQALEDNIEKIIYGGRFLTLLGVWGSLVGSFLCFIKGCTFVVASFMEYPVSRGKVILLLVEALDVYLLGTVMLVFGMGLYEIFVSNLDVSKSLPTETNPYRSNLFGLFTLKERPKWLEIKSVNELKTKLGHVIVMVLLIGLFEKSKKVVISNPVDLLCFSASILLSAGCLYLLSKLNNSK